MLRNGEGECRVIDEECEKLPGGGSEFARDERHVNLVAFDAS